MRGPALTTLVFVFNGASFAATGPNGLTSGAAAVLQAAGNRVVQLSTPAINARTFGAVAANLMRSAHGQEVGLVAFSAGALWPCVSRRPRA